MNQHDVRILRGAAVPAGVVGLLVTAVSGVLAGGKGAMGALFGALLVAAFFSVGHVVIAWASRTSPVAMMGVAVLTYTVKVLLLGLVLVTFEDTRAFDRRAFAAAIAVCTLVWVVAQVRAFSRQRLLYVEPSDSTAPVGGSAGGDAEQQEPR